MDKIINGKIISQKIREDLKIKLSLLEKKLKLVVIQVGNNEASNTYIRNKNKACVDVGILFELIKYDENVSEEELIMQINRLNNDDEVTGILVQLPLPKHLNENHITNHINSAKDVDGLSDINVGKLANQKECLVSCTPLGVIEILKQEKIEMQCKHVVIVGRSSLVGKPLIQLFLQENATVTICHSKTFNLGEFTKEADILVVAIGQKHFINENMVKKDAVIIDVGINNQDGNLYGDVDFDKVIDKVLKITPVPGGVGPMTIAMLLCNIYKAYKIKNNL